MDGSADRAPGYWRGVRNQIQRSRMKRFETKSDHEGASDGNRSAESRCAFNKRSKTKCHQQDLQAAIGGDAGNRFFHDLELAGFDRDVIKIDGRQHDPSYFYKSESNTVLET